MVVANHDHVGKVDVPEPEDLVDQDILAHGFAVVNQQGLGVVPDLKPMILPKQLQGGLRVIAKLRQGQAHGDHRFRCGWCGPIA